MNKLRATLSFLVLLVGVLSAGVLAGCATEILPPTAAPRVDPAEVAVGATVRLDGSESADPQSLPLFFQWSFVELPPGSAAELLAADTAKPYFVADLPGDFVVALVVSNGTTTSEAVAVTITAGPCGANVPVIDSITATPDSPGVGQSVGLSAAVTDADTASPCDLVSELHHDWAIVSAPAGSQAKLNLPNGTTPSFEADRPGDYVIELVVTDSQGDVSAPSTLTITASQCADNAPVVAPVMATPASPAVGQVVHLVTSVTDADEAAPCNLAESFGYEWAIVGQPAGSGAVLNNAGADAPSFVPDVAGDYVVKVVVTDSQGHPSAPVVVTVTASTCGEAPPTALIEELAPVLGTPGTVVVAPDSGVNTTVQMSAVSSSDADNADPCNLAQTLTYKWFFLALPAGSGSALNNDAIVNPSFFIDRAGTYVVGLVVTDSAGVSSEMSTFTIHADPAIGIGVPAGFTITSLATWPAIDGPRGLTKDGGGNIYVVLGSASQIKRVAPDGKVAILTQGGFLNGPHDVAFEPGSSLLYVTGGFNQIATVDLAGVQNLCAQNSNSQYRGIDFFNGTGGLRLVVADQAADRVAFHDPATCGQSTTNSYNNTLSNPWGVAAAVLGGEDEVFVADSTDEEIWRNTDGAYTTNGGTNTLISNASLIGNPRDLVLTPCPTPKLVLANRDGANLLLFANGAGVQPGVIVTSMIQPTGLYFEDANNLLVTDEILDAVFRITGPFCSL